MRYRLSRKFSLQASSGSEHSGADLLYSIELR
jgi:hypothetical protein